MGLPKRLTDKQIKFANLLIANDGRKTATECAIEAGYDKDSAYVTASRLQNPKHYPLVVQYIGDRKSEMLKKYDVTYERHMAELGKIRDEARFNKAWTAAGNMEIARGKAAGFYTNQSVHLHKHENLSQEEIDKRVAEALKHYQPIIEGEVEIITDELSSSPKPEESLYDPQK